MLKQQTATRLDLVSEGLTKYHVKCLQATEGNLDTIIDFVLASQTERNWRLNTKQSYIQTLSIFSKFHNNKPFNKIIRNDNISFLNSFRRSEQEDPLHQWIGTYNLYNTHITMFFKWFYNPQLELRDRPKPPCVKNIPQLPRMEQSIYKPEDMWSVEDDLLFLKYCPFLRDKCYHAISRDSSCRPHELLKLKIKDVNFKQINGRLVAELQVNGKTGNRSIPLFNSIPHLKNWLDVHPQRNNPNSVLICSMGPGISHQIKSDAVGKIYERSKKYFEQLIDTKIDEEDKIKIKELLKKHWNPYVRRHSAITEKAKMFNESIMRQHCGWTADSSMILKYTHYFGNESSTAILEGYGIKPKQEDVNKMKPKQCPNCDESNEINSKFCRKCRMVLSYDAYAQVNEEKDTVNDKIDVLQSQLRTIVSSLSLADQTTKNKMAKSMVESGLFK